jgi:polyhydroxyalkanoate synthesis regulator phasin
MALEALRAYLELASGLTEASRQRAKEVAQLLISAGALDQTIGPLGKQAQQIAEDLIATSRANRQLLMTLVRAEVDRGIAALGLPTREELDRLQRRVTRLEQAVAAEGSPAKKAAAATATPPPASAPTTPPTTTPAQPAAKKTATRRTTKKPSVRPSVRAAAKRTPAKPASAVEPETTRESPETTRESPETTTESPGAGSGESIRNATTGTGT